MGRRFFIAAQSITRHPRKAKQTKLVSSALENGRTICFVFSLSTNDIAALQDAEHWRLEFVRGCRVTGSPAAINLLLTDSLLCPFKIKTFCVVGLVGHRNKFPPIRSQFVQCGFRTSFLVFPSLSCCAEADQECKSNE